MSNQSSRITAQWGWLPIALALLLFSMVINVLLAVWMAPAPLTALLSTPTPQPTATILLVPTFTPTSWIPTATATPTLGVPTPTNTPVTQSDSLQFTRKQVAVNRASPDFTALSKSLSTQFANVPITNKSKLVLAHYFAWFDDTSWYDCNMSAGDQPLQPYHSDDPSAIARHVQMAQEVLIDGFTLHWFIEGDRTDRNFATLLRQSEGKPFYSTVVFSRHIYHGAGSNQPIIAQALAYIVNQHGAHPNFLRVNNRPVIFFTDIYRAPTQPGQSPQQFWLDVRNQIDPQRQTVWIAEGLDTSYLTAFDGLYVFKITHTTSPHDYQKSSSWANQVRRAGNSKLWVATISPGWDDLTSGCKADVRAPAPLHRMDRQNGAYYQATFEAAIKSKPDWLIIGSFNEWVEGSYIEPSVLYGDRYLTLTKDFIKLFKRSR